ncbi:hypothetical protein LKD70_14185 [Ruminococcus sp. CLA-AA-H200]|uniref:DUF1540 domain-containing protein n=1 Tax=Ruminococcus turbiniformis TaxID=2881258 RepID=A0ABS8G0Y7_9FIRM|nr:hypothetical protein [Ruminococcus turbiniformis]MCC2255549.1 hypothetical protein [Ruminococcus turbiniformis]
MKKCVCGNTTFYAHQVCRLDIVVDGDNEFVRNAFATADASIYDSGNPYGPYTCTSCNREYGDWDDIPDIQ